MYKLRNFRSLYTLTKVSVDNERYKVIFYTKILCFSRSKLTEEELDALRGAIFEKQDDNVCKNPFI